MLALEQQPHLRPVINATGVVINTNLGRAPLSMEALLAVQQVSSGYRIWSMTWRLVIAVPAMCMWPLCSAS